MRAVSLPCRHMRLYLAVLRADQATAAWLDVEAHRCRTPLCFDGGLRDDQPGDDISSYHRNKREENGEEYKAYPKQCRISSKHLPQTTTNTGYFPVYAGPVELSHKAPLR